MGTNNGGAESIEQQCTDCIVREFAVGGSNSVIILCCSEDWINDSRKIVAKNASVNLKDMR